MKIAFVFPERLPLKKARAISVINTVSALSKLVNTTFIIPTDSASKEEIEEFYKVDLSSTNLMYIKNSVFKIKSNKIFNFYLSKIIHNFDVFYVRHLKTAKFLIKNKLPHQKVVFEVHEVFYRSLEEEKPFEKKKIESLKSLEKFVYQNSDALVFINKSLQAYLKKDFKLIPKKEKVIYLATNFKVPFISKQFNDVSEIFYCGSLYKWKGVEVAIKALSYLPNNLKLFVIGGEEEKKIELTYLAKNLGVEDRVKFFSFVPHKEILEILKNKAKITVIPNSLSIFNIFSFPIKLLEYMITSNIVIASDTPVIKEVIQDGVNGFLFKTGDPESLAKVVKKVLNLPSEELLKVAKNAYNTAIKFTYENRAKEILKFLKQL